MKRNNFKGFLAPLIVSKCFVDFYKKFPQKLAKTVVFLVYYKWREEMTQKMALVLRLPASKNLPDNSHFTHRFEIKSSSSNRVYVVAQSKSGRWWACSCPGWIRHKHCKHLSTLGLPGGFTPFLPSNTSKKSSHSPKRMR